MELRSPYRVFPQHQYLIQDGAGAIFWLALLNHQGKSGAVVYKLQGSQVVPILERGYMCGYSTFSLIDGALHVVSPDLNDPTLTHVDRVPDFVPIAQGSGGSQAVYVIDTVAREQAAQALSQASYAVSRANGAWSVANGTAALLTELQQRLYEEAKALTDRIIPEIAWAKAQDALAAQWAAWVSYKDVRLLNLIYNRVLKHVHTLGIKDTSSIKRAEPVE